MRFPGMHFSTRARTCQQSPALMAGALGPCLYLPGAERSNVLTNNIWSLSRAEETIPRQKDTEGWAETDPQSQGTGRGNGCIEESRNSLGREVVYFLTKGRWRRFIKSHEHGAFGQVGIEEGDEGRGTDGKCQSRTKAPRGQQNSQLLTWAFQ